MMAGLGGAAAVVITSGRGSGRACGASAIVRSTVGAPFRCVTPSPSMSSQIRPASTARRHTCVPPIAASAHPVHQPLQWNIGSVQR
jgi:hypothetical protein